MTFSYLYRPLTWAFFLLVVLISVPLQGQSQLTLLHDLELDGNALLMPSSATYGRAINGVSFQTEPFLTKGGYQYAAWYHLGETDEDVYLARRNLSGTTWEVMDTGSNFDNGDGSWDAHNVISMGVSGDGRLHYSWDMHGNTLRYRNSVAGAATDIDWNASVLNSELNTLNPGGASISTVTYPSFISDPGSGNMFLNYRTGGSGNGDTNLATYSATTGLWNTPHQIINGTSSILYDDAYGASSLNRNAYLNGMDIDSTGRLHTTWTWREEATGSSNHDICYAYSDDGGNTWRNNAGTIVGTVGSPIDLNSPGITVVPMDRGSTLMNQQTQAVDGDGRVHVVMWHKTDDAPPVTGFTTAPAAYFHYFRNPATGAWTRTELPTSRAVGSRPDMAYDEFGNLYVTYLSPGVGDAGNYYTSGDLIIASASKATGYQDWQIVHTDTRDFAGEPFLDQNRLLQDGVVSVFIQENNAAVTGVTSTPLHILEYTKLENLVSWAGDSTGHWSQGGGTDWDNDSDDLGDAVFANGFRVAFDDGAANFNVNIARPVSPSATAFYNTVGHNYTLTGDGIVGAGGLRIAGGGTVALANSANTYSGDTNIENGTLVLAGPATVSASPTIHVSAGAALNVSGVYGGFHLAGGQTLQTDGNSQVVGTVTAGSASLVTGIGTFANHFIAQSGAVVRVGGQGLPSTVASSVTLVDDFSDASLSAYTQTKVLDQAGSDGGTSKVNFFVQNGLLGSFKFSGTDAEQVLLLRDDAPLLVGQELLVTPNITITGSQDLGIVVAATETPDGLGNPQVGSTRSDIITLYLRNGQTNLYTRGFDGTTEFGLVSGTFTGIDDLFIARAALDTFEVGCYDNGLRRVLTTRTVGNTAIGAAVGFFTDMRNAATILGMDNLRIVEPPHQVFQGETLTVEGDFTIEPGASLQLDLYDASAVDTLAVGGHLNLGGTLEIALEPSAPSPALGDTIDLFDFASASGNFDTFVLPSLPNGLAWNVSKLPVSGTLEVVADVDMDNDGDVDGQDFLAIQRTAPGLFPSWLSLYGTRLVTPLTAAVQVVPEPASLVMLLLTLPSLHRACFLRSGDQQ